MGMFSLVSNRAYETSPTQKDCVRQITRKCETRDVHHLFCWRIIVQTKKKELSNGNTTLMPSLYTGWFIGILTLAYYELWSLYELGSTIPYIQLSSVSATTHLIPMFYTVFFEYFCPGVEMISSNKNGSSCWWQPEIPRPTTVWMLLKPRNGNHNLPTSTV